MIYNLSKETSCCFTGHRPEKFPFSVAEDSANFSRLIAILRWEIEKAISRGYTHFISGMSRGIDLWAAECVIKLKSKYPHITLEAAIPCKNQCAMWSAEDTLTYEKVLSQCDKCGIVTNLSGAQAMLARNRYMVDNASLVIAALDPNSNPYRGGTRATVNYAIKSGVKVVNILADLEIFS